MENLRQEILPNKTFTVEKNGKISIVIIRQMPHDRQYKIGSVIPSYGKVLSIA